MKPLISIIIPAYNIAGLLQGMVSDLLAQPFRFFEILIVLREDDPDTARAAEEMSHTDDRIRVIYRNSPGVSAGRNAGIEAARGELLVDTWESRRLVSSGEVSVRGVYGYV